MKGFKRFESEGNLIKVTKGITRQDRPGLLSFVTDIEGAGQRSLEMQGNPVSGNTGAQEIVHMQNANRLGIFDNED